MPTAKAVRSRMESAGPRVRSPRTSPVPRNAASTTRRDGSERRSQPRYKGGYPGSPTARQVRGGIEASGPHAPGTPSGRPSSLRSSRGGGRSSGRPGSNVSVPGVSTSARTGALIAEFLLAEVFIWWGIFVAKKKYSEAISSALWQSTAVIMVFFILALVSRGEKTSKAAVAFGAIIDLGIIFAATQNGVIAAMGNQITGKGTGMTTAVLTSASESDAQPPQHEATFGSPAETS